MVQNWLVEFVKSFIFGFASEKLLIVSTADKSCWQMECNERVLCGTGEVELDPNIVSEEAGKLYSELQVQHSCLPRIICHVFSK